MDELTLVDVAVAEPDVDGVEPSDVREPPEPHFFANLAHRRGAVRFAGADVALRERPLAVRVNHHGEKRLTADALEHEAPSGNLVAMPLVRAASLARADGSPRPFVAFSQHHNPLKSLQ